MPEDLSVSCTCPFCPPCPRPARLNCRAVRTCPHPADGKTVSARGLPSGFKGARVLAPSCRAPPGLRRLQKSLLPRAALTPRPGRRVFLAGTLRPSQPSCPHAPQASRARPQSRGPLSSRGRSHSQSRCRRALCRPLPEVPASSRPCHLLLRPPTPAALPGATVLSVPAPRAARKEKGGKVRKKLNHQARP